MAIIAPHVPPEKLSGSRRVDQRLVAGEVVFRMPNNRAPDSDGGRRRAQTRCDFRHSGKYGETVRSSKNSLNPGPGCRSRTGNGRGLSTTARPPRPCDARACVSARRGGLWINLWKLWITLDCLAPG